MDFEHHSRKRPFPVGGKKPCSVQQSTCSSWGMVLAAVTVLCYNELCFCETLFSLFTTVVVAPECQYIPMLKLQLCKSCLKLKWENESGGRRQGEKKRKHQMKKATFFCDFWLVCLLCCPGRDGYWRTFYSTGELVLKIHQALATYQTFLGPF